MLARVRMFQEAMRKDPEVEIFGLVDGVMIRLTAWDLAQLSGRVEIDVVMRRDRFEILNWEEVTG